MGQIWNGSAFESYTTGNYANYPISATEQGTASAYYAGDMPALSAGVYYITAKERVGGSPAESDISIGWGPIQWNGTVVSSLNSVILLSGQSFVASGINTVVPKETISGVIANSGLFVTVPIATISGAIANSGLFVTLPKETISGVIANSGLFVTATATVASGQVWLASGSVILPSGGLVGLLSGQFVNVYSGQLSGFEINLHSGNVVAVLSGTRVNVFSGSTILASGSIFTTTFASGVTTAHIPDRILQRDFTASSGFIASGMSGRAIVNALRKLTNAWDMTTRSGHLTIFQEDDITVAFQQAVTATSGADPVTSLDTV